MSEPRWRRRFRVPALGFPSWARDDPDRLVYVSNESGTTQVHVWDRRANERRPLTDVPHGTGHRVPPRIGTDGRQVWWFLDDKGNELGRWMREPFAGGARETVAPELPPAYSGWLALGSSVAVLGRSRSDEGSSIYVLREGSARRIYAHRQSARVADLSRDERLVAISHSEHRDARNPALRVLDLEGRRVADLSDGPGKGVTPFRWSPVAGDARLLAFHERDGIERPLIFNARTGKDERIAIDLPGEVEADWYPRADALLLVHEHRGRNELYRLELPTRALTRLDNEAGTLQGARVRPDGEVWYLLDRSSAPREVRAVGGGRVLAPPDLDEARGVTYADVDVGSVHVFVAEPTTPRPHPTYFYVHGGPSASDRDSFSPTVQAWVDHGFAVVMPNYRGSSGYGKAWRDAIVGRPGLTELEDVAAVQDWAVASGLADPRRCVLGGGSWGGYLTLLGLGTQPERWAAGVAIVPIGDYVAAFEDEMESLKRFDAALFGGTPTDIPETYRRSNPITYIDNVRVPVLLLIGENDPRCPSRGADVYVARLREIGKRFEELRYDAGHGSLVVDDQIAQVARQLAFVSRALGTPAPA